MIDLPPIKYQGKRKKEREMTFTIRKEGEQVTTARYGGWVGGWGDWWVEEDKAARTRCCELGVGLGGWVDARKKERGR